VQDFVGGNENLTVRIRRNAFQIHTDRIITRRKITIGARN
jgi:hypothetical protein